MTPQTDSGSRTTRPRAATEPRRAGRSRANWRKLVPVVNVAGLVIIIVAGLWPKPIEVEIEAIHSGPLTVSVLEEGKTRIRHRYVMSPPVSGFLHRIALRAGDRIEAGKTVLAVIESEPASFLNPRIRAETEARVKATEAARQRTAAELEKARAAHGLAERDFVRSQALRRQGAIAARDFDAAENQVAVLSREVRALEFALQTAEFEVAQAKAALQQVENPGTESAPSLTITAPVTGFVLNVMEENARVVMAGTPIMEVGDPTDLEAEIELLSSDAVGVQPGASVSLERWGGDAPLRGRVSVVEPGGYTKVSALGVEEQRVKVRVDFVDPIPPEHPLGDRFRVEARIITWSAQKVLQVPTGALFRRGDDWMTFIVASGRAKMRKVEIGHNNGVAAEIRSGLQENERVVLHPPDRVTDGARIKPRRSL
jgi:HlyD family secretion protein